MEGDSEFVEEEVKDIVKEVCFWCMLHGGNRETEGNDGHVLEVCQVPSMLTIRW